MIKVGIIGASGYAGIELIRLLVGHPQAEIKFATWVPYKEGETLEDICPHFKGIINLPNQETNVPVLAPQVDVVFLAVPHGLAMDFVPAILKAGAKVIDFSADYRIENVKVYEEWYKEHTSAQLLKEAVFGLPELYRSKIKGAKLIANPGCYPTVSILSLAPLLKEGIIDPDTIVIDAKSGVSGAGRNPNPITHYCEVNESMKAYAVGTHRHTPEIEQEVSKLSGKEVKVSFTPHLTPMGRGILATSYAGMTNVKCQMSNEEVIKIYNKFYKDEPFVRIFEKGLPSTKYVSGTNYCDIGLKVDSRTNRIVVVGAIDNLIKGASGQAVQNFNLMCGIDEKMGIELVSVYP
jgi:N-acetyl-gamma-glutamyl-phosphate reductase